MKFAVLPWNEDEFITTWYAFMEFAKLVGTSRCASAESVAELFVFNRFEGNALNPDTAMIAGSS